MIKCVHCGKSHSDYRTTLNHIRLAIEALEREVRKVEEEHR